MLSLLAKMLSRRRPRKRARDPARYEVEKRLAKDGAVKERMALAKDERTHPEILYYLAEHDPDAEVRLAVAKNPGTPVQASVLLSKDKSPDVRLALAGRLAGLVPGLPTDLHSQLYAFTVQALGTLALDEVLKIRVALASAIKDCAHAPPAIVNTLARDLERQVAEPVLRCCAALSDDDLIDILKSHPETWAAQAVAARPRVSPPVSRAIFKSGNREAGKILLENPGADIPEDTLKEIVEQARLWTELQKPVALRKSLPPAMARELAGFVDVTVRDLLLRRDDFDSETAQEIADIFRRRLDFVIEQEGKSDQPPEERILVLKKQGKLNEATLSDAIAMREREFAIEALAALSQLDRGLVNKVINLRTPKAVVAVSWKAGVSMRTALKVQQDLARIPAHDLLYPRDGVDYPLSEDELRWQLKFLGVK